MMGGIMEQKKYFDKELFPTQTTYIHTPLHIEEPPYWQLQNTKLGV